MAPAAPPQRRGRTDRLGVAISLTPHPHTPSTSPGQKEWPPRYYLEAQAGDNKHYVMYIVAQRLAQRSLTASSLNAMDQRLAQLRRASLNSSRKTHRTPLPRQVLEDLAGRDPHRFELSQLVDRSTLSLTATNDVSDPNIRL